MHFGATPAASAYPTLRVGARGAEVRTLQERLAMVGLLTSSDVDGIYGERTAQAVRNLQYRWYQPQTGVATGETHVALAKSVANGLPAGPTLGPAAPDQPYPEKRLAPATHLYLTLGVALVIAYLIIDPWRK